MAVIHRWMIYGAYGYTGRLIVEEAVNRGHLPILGGRDEAKLLDVADQFNLEYQAFALDHPHKIKNAIKDVELVLNCAGPFSQTATALRAACLANGCHYLDITGEIDVLTASYDCHQAAREQGIVVISGVGFDVVPTDVLASLLKQALPEATHLELAFAGDGGVSPGTAKTMVEMLPERGKIRREGEIVTVPLAYQCKDVPFNDATRHVMSIPWGDVATAFFSTDIPNIIVYTAVEKAQAKWAGRMNMLTPLLGKPFMQRWFKKWIGKNITGPDSDQRQNGFMQLWGKATTSTDSVELTMTTPEGYSFTVVAALLFVESILAHKIMPGAYTPSQALPLDVITEMEGVEVHQAI